MTYRREPPEAIQWHEGMLLTPQHFQQADLRHAALLHHHLGLVSPYHWGVRQLEISEDRLSQGTLEIRQIEAVMPDGLLVSGEAGRISLDLRDLAKKTKAWPVTLHLAVVVEHARSAADDERARYDSRTGPKVVDINNGDGEVSIPRLRPRLHLMPAGELTENWVSMPLVQIDYRNEAFKLRQELGEGFSCPMLCIGRGSPLRKEGAAIAKLLREKATSLAAQMDPSPPPELPSQRLDKKTAAHSLAAALPLLEALLQTGSTHPYALYLALCTVAGKVAILSPDLVPPPPPPYEHDNVFASFNELCGYIRQTLRQGFPENWHSLLFSYDEKGKLFYIDFDPAWRGRKLVLGVRARAGASSQETADWVHRSIIASASRMAEMEKSRITGAGREAVQSSGDLVPSRGVSLFEVEKLEAGSSEYIVDRREPLHVRNPDDPQGLRRPVEIVLHVHKKQV